MSNPWALVTIGQAGEILDVEPRRAVEIARSAGVREIRVGWQVRFRVGDIEALARQRREGG